MCGIAGIYRTGKEPIREEVIASFLTGNEHRGNDASGIALLQADGRICVFKKDITPWEFVQNAGYLEFIRENLLPDTLAAIVHARGASQGNPRDNNNNHPLYQGLSAVIHNGVIRNDDFLFKELKLVRKAATDSDLLRAVFDQHGFNEPAYKDLNRMSGGVAMAAFHPAHPGKMLLARSGNPLVMASNENFLVFASEKHTIHRAMRPYIHRYGIWFQATKPDVDFGLFPNHTLWLIGPKGLEMHTKFYTHAGDFVEPIRRVYDGYEERSKKFDKDAAAKKEKQVKVIMPINKAGEKKDFGWCAKCQKEYVIPFGADPSTFCCPKGKGGCGATLSPVRKKGATVVA